MNTVNQNTQKVCPTCGHTYLINEEFCQDDFTELVFASTEEVNHSVNDEESVIDENQEDIKNSLDDDYSDDVFAELDITPTDNTSQITQDNLANQHDLIPQKLRDKGYQYESRKNNSYLYDDIFVTCPQGNLQVLRTYHTGTLSTDTALQRIKGKNFDLLDFGMDNLQSFSKDWELLKYQDEEEIYLLRELMNEHAHESEFALAVAQELAMMIKRMPQDIIPISLEPEFLYFDDDRFQLSFFGALHADKVNDKNKQTMDKTQGIYLPKLETTTTISNVYRAPELEEGILQTNSIVFSIGQIVAETYFGQALSLSAIREGNIPFNKIADDDLRALLMGCLYPDHTDRWQVTDIINLCEHGEIANFGKWSSLQTGASKHCLILGNDEQEIECWSPIELANAITPERWDECLAMMDKILHWLESTHKQSLAMKLKTSLQNNEISRDYVLVNLKRTLTPNVPIIWREFSLAEHDVNQTLTALAQQALKGDEIANKRLQQLHDSKLVTSEFNAIDMV